MDPRFTVEKQGRTLPCPTCGTVLRVHIGLRLEVSETTEEPSAPQLDSESQRLVDAARASGLLSTFHEVVERIMQDRIPKDVDRFFVTFLRTATPRRIPRFALDRFNKMFAHRHLEYWGAQDVGMVIVDGHIRLFVPQQLLRGTAVRRMSGGKAGSRRQLDIAVAPEQLEEWIRTQWGYVAGEGALLTMFRRKAIGDFALPGI